MTATVGAWDVAISFVWDDVDRAREIAAALGGLRVFVAPNHPEATVGADGVEAFSQIYGRDASLVVVLHREQWGQTGWTSIEKAAINSRRVNEKTDEFLMIVRMDQAPPPPWLPASRIYGEWQPLGTNGVAGAIFTRLQALGTVVPPESPLDVVARMAAKKGLGSSSRPTPRRRQRPNTTRLRCSRSWKRLLRRLTANSPRMRVITSWGRPVFW